MINMTVPYATTRRRKITFNFAAVVTLYSHGINQFDGFASQARHELLDGSYRECFYVQARSDHCTGTHTRKGSGGGREMDGLTIQHSSTDAMCVTLGKGQSFTNDSHSSFPCEIWLNKSSTLCLQDLAIGSNVVDDERLCVADAEITDKGGLWQGC
jgi:hypothetical protein